ncbi:cytochrome p450 [Stylonychia lemnae]|uniref:Cytochrome p450 n=1 Tax=Stylonychia lemnae TaxID=5949 RepID=A0A078A797_STYLE|nr:cytochrome p450 [Stylonychia lemnae]|eukprot:CDW77402.1 cytochrome p450 [Stylonychia lemnae]
MWYYTRQCLHCPRIPWPILGDIFTLQRVIAGFTEYSDSQLVEYYNFIYKDKPIPSVFIDFRTGEGQLIISDPEMVQEIYVTKAKYVDKYHRGKKFQHDLFGESILFDRTTEVQAMRRKRLSTAFYKEKMTQNLNIIIKQTFNWVQGIKQDIKQGKNERELGSMIGEHLLDCILTSVFGETKHKKFLKYIIEGDNTEDASLTVIVSRIFIKLSRKPFRVFRLFTHSLDTWYIGEDEKNIHKNIINYRNMLSELIYERRQAMKDPNFDGADFLTLLLTDDLYREDDNLIKDEITTFLFASTQTTAATITNLMYYLEFVPNVRQKLVDEICTMLSPDREKLLKIDQIDMTQELWIEKLGYDKLQDDWKYLYLLIQETLRIEPPVRASTPLQLSEKQNICGIDIDTNITFQIHFYFLQRNPKEWQQPDKFIPERFDPESPFYLTPDGKKRKPNSFSPFFGGKRICLGKTFAENFKKPIHYEKKVPKTFFNEINVPIILSTIK